LSSDKKAKRDASGKQGIESEGFSHIRQYETKKRNESIHHGTGKSYTNKRKTKTYHERHGRRRDK